jgi:hypothetical protein
LAIISLLPGVSAVRAEEQPHSYLKPHEYGELYVLEQNDKETPNWNLGLNYSYELSNPYINLHGMTLTVEHSLSKYLYAGILLTYYVSSQTYLMQTLYQELARDNILADSQVPKYNALAILTLKPLAGHMNFFGNKPVNLEVGLRVGVGYVSYPSEGILPALFWSLRPAVYLSKSILLETGLGQFWDGCFSDKSLVHLRIEAGLTVEL